MKADGNLEVLLEPEVSGAEMKQHDNKKAVDLVMFAEARRGTALHWVPAPSKRFFNKDYPLISFTRLTSITPPRHVATASVRWKRVSVGTTSLIAPNREIKVNTLFAKE